MPEENKKKRDRRQRIQERLVQELANSKTHQLLKERIAYHEAKIEEERRAKAGEG